MLIDGKDLYNFKGFKFEIYWNDKQDIDKDFVSLQKIASTDDSSYFIINYENKNCSGLMLLIAD